MNVEFEDPTTDKVFYNEQMDYLIIHLLEVQIPYPEIHVEDYYSTPVKSAPTVKPAIQIMRNTCDQYDSHTSLEDFVQNSFEVFEWQTSTYNGGDDGFIFRMNSASTMVAKHSRRGCAQNVYVGPGVKFGPVTLDYLPKTKNNFVFRPGGFLKEGQLLFLYQGSSPIDVPFIYNPRLGILKNIGCERYGLIINVPESQRG